MNSRRPLPKRHHFVPEAILKRFVDENAWLHLYSTKDRAPRVRRTRPENAFLEGHLYSQLTDDGDHDPAVEIWLSELESAVEPVLEKLTRAGAAGRVPGLTHAERDIWEYFFFFQWKRVPDLHLTVATDAEAQEYFSTLREELRRKYPSRADEIDALEEPTVAKRMLKNARVAAVSKPPSAKVLSALKSRGIALLRITDPRKAFVIGSRPILQMGFREGLTLKDQPTEIWLPIASDLAVGVGRIDTPELIVDLRDHATIRLMNREIARKSTAFASRSAALTESLAKARLGVFDRSE